MLPWQTFKFSDLDKIHINRKGLLKKLSAEKYSKHLKSMETINCHSSETAGVICHEKQKISIEALLTLLIARW